MEYKNTLENEVLLSSEDENMTSALSFHSDYDDEEFVDDGIFVFHRNKNNNYLPVRELFIHKMLILN